MCEVRAMRWPDDLFYFSLFLFGYLAGPIALVWGWISFARRRREEWNWMLMISFVGFLAASLSAVLGLAIILYPWNGAEDDAVMKLFYRWIALEAALSILGFALAVAGIWKPNRLRWQAPIGALGTLAFWLIATTWP
jgi:hypothetical protein